MAETKTKVAPAGNADDSSSSATANAGQTNPRPTNTGVVDSSSVEDNGNSGSSDESDGSDSGESGRQRSSKAERRIAELTSRIKELQEKKTQDSDAVTQLLMAHNGNPNLPDYTGEEEVPAAKVAKDVYEALSKDLDAKLAGSLGVIQNRSNIQAAARQNILEAQQAKREYAKLDDGNPDTFDPDIAKEIDDGFIDIFNVKPDYSYAEHVRKFRSVLGPANTNTDATGSPQAVRPQAQAKRSKEFSSSMSTDEMKDWFAARRT